MGFFKKDGNGLKGNNDVVMFFVGLVMFVVGLFLFLHNVSIIDAGNLFAFYLGGHRLDGLVFVPLIASIIFLFYKYNTVSKVCCVLSIIIILVNVIMNLKFHWLSTSLFVTIIIFVLLFGGAGLLLRVIFANPKGKHGKNFDDKE